MEIWKDIENYPDYKVSNLGRVMSYKREIAHILKGGLSSGYLLLQLNRGQKPRIKKTPLYSPINRSDFYPKSRG